MTDATDNRAASRGTRIEIAYEAVTSLELDEARRIQRAMYAAAAETEARIVRDRATLAGSPTKEENP
jgi:hypothetical protein